MSGILGSIWVPLDNLGTTVAIARDTKNRFFEIFQIYRYTLGTEWYPKWYSNGTQIFFIEKYEVSTF